MTVEDWRTTAREEPMEKREDEAKKGTTETTARGGKPGGEKPGGEKPGIAERLLALRRCRRLRQVDVAGEIGVCRETICRIEVGYVAGEPMRARIREWLEDQERSLSEVAGALADRRPCGRITAVTRTEAQLETPLEIAMAPVREQISLDKKKLPDKYKGFQDVVSEYLIEKKLTVTWALKKARIHGHSFSTDFYDCVGELPGDYILIRRLEVAERLLRDFNYRVGIAASMVSIDSMRTFRRGFRKWFDVQRPKDIRGQRLGHKIPLPTLRQAASGDLDLISGREVVVELRRFFPDPVDPGESVRDGPPHERLRAAKTWRQIRDLPFEEQREAVDWHPYRTTALFDLLREKSRREGRKDRQRGVRLAKLALVALGRTGEARSERFYDLQAEGLICLGNARRLERDFRRSDEELVAARASWRVRRSRRDPLVGARIDLNQGTVRMFERRYDEGVVLIEKALPVFEEEGDVKGQVQALNQRAAIRGYLDQLEESISDLDAAASLVDGDQHRYLAFTIHKNLALSYVRAGDSKPALRNLELSRGQLAKLDYPLGETELKWLEASIREVAGEPAVADSLYCEAHSGLAVAGEDSSSAVLLLDRSALCSQEGRHAEVIRLLSEALPILESHQFYPETVAGLALVSEAIRVEEVSTALLRDLQDRLHKDPLVLLI